MRKFFFAILFITCILFISSHTFADITYVIKRGDSLYKISKKFDVPIDEIKIKNEITSSRIKPGTKLIIPTESKSPDRKIVEQSNTSTPQGEKNLVSVPLDATHYIVEKGDTLSTIAHKYSVSVKKLKALNNLKSTKIKPGQKLLLRETKSKEQSKKYNTIISGGPAKREKFEIKINHYTVKKGDTLSSISKKYSISVREIMELNDLRSTKLKPGQQLLIKRTEIKIYTVKKGDSIFKISRKFDIDIDELKDINRLETDCLKPGQKLLLEPEETEELAHNKETLSEAQIEKEITEDPESEKSGLKDRLILFAKKFINTPYRFGGTSLFGIDCSGFVQKVYRMIGINLPRSAREQFREGNPINTADLSIGDLVFFRTYAPFPSHVGIYLGDNLFIHASSKEKKVTIDNLTEPFYIKRFIGAKRVIGNDISDGG